MTSNLNRQIGEQIRTLRKRASLSQEEVAERTEISVHHYGFIERGQTKAPLLDNLERIAKALGVNVRDVFDFPREARQERKELLQQIIKSLKRRNETELLTVKHIVELLPPTHRK